MNDYSISHGADDARRLAIHGAAAGHGVNGHAHWGGWDAPDHERVGDAFAALVAALDPDSDDRITVEVTWRHTTQSGREVWPSVSISGFPLTIARDAAS